MSAKGPDWVCGDGGPGPTAELTTLAALRRPASGPNLRVGGSGAQSRAVADPVFGSELQPYVSTKVSLLDDGPR
jgi:hypothetical protein